MVGRGPEPSRVCGRARHSARLTWPSRSQHTAAPRSAVYTGRQCKSPPSPPGGARRERARPRLASRVAQAAGQAGDERDHTARSRLVGARNQGQQGEARPHRRYGGRRVEEEVDTFSCIGSASLSFYSRRDRFRLRFRLILHTLTRYSYCKLHTDNTEYSLRVYHMQR